MYFTNQNISNIDKVLKDYNWNRNFQYYISLSNEVLAEVRLNPYPYSVYTFIDRLVALNVIISINETIQNIEESNLLQSYIDNLISKFESNTDLIDVLTENMVEKYGIISEKFRYRVPKHINNLFYRNTKFICPICGYNKLENPPFNIFGEGCYDICDCCFNEFGFDIEELEKSKLANLTETWVKNGAVPRTVDILSNNHRNVETSCFC